MKATLARRTARRALTAADVTVIVLAKAPVAGRVKTRLCPPCTPAEAATLAEAALADTLAAAVAPAAVHIPRSNLVHLVCRAVERDVYARGGGVVERLPHAQLVGRD